MQTISGRIRSFQYATETTFLFCVKGSFVVQKMLQEDRLEQGEWLIINPGEVYALMGEEPWKAALFTIPAERTNFYMPHGEELFTVNRLRKKEIEQFLFPLMYMEEDLIEDGDKRQKTEQLLMMELINHHRSVYQRSIHLKEDPEEARRALRIIDYIRRTYDKRPNLQRLAEEEFLTLEYLSWKTRDLFGMSFKELIGMWRIRQSLPLLLHGKKSIQEVSDRVGYSSPRYFNGAFLKWTGMKPIAFRDQVLDSSETVEGVDTIETLFPHHPRNMYPVLTQEDSLVLSIDLNEERKGGFAPRKRMDLGDVTLLLEEENRRLLEELQSEMHMTEGILRNVFSADMDFYTDGSFTNYNRIEQVLEFLEDLDMRPIIFVEDPESHRDNMEEFQKNFPHVDIIETLDDEEWKEEQLKAYDTMKGAAYLTYKMAQGNEITPRFVDEIKKTTQMTNDTFFGGPGLFTASGLKKSSYFSHMFLYFMEGEILQQEPGLLVTEKDEIVHILVYHPSEMEVSDLHRDGETLRPLDISILIYGIEKDFLVTHFVLDKDHGSVYDAFLKIGSPKRISHEHWDFLDEYIGPGLEFKRYKKTPNFHLFLPMEPYSVHYITLDFSQI